MNGGSQLDDERRRNIERTYYGLRLGMVALAALLFASIFYDRLLVSECFQSSISAYYYTPARPVFIAALCAIGAGLVIYRGTTPVENAFFNVAGALAFVVALVPTAFRAQDARCGALDVPAKDVAIENNITALVVAGFVAAAVVWFNLARFRKESSTGRSDSAERVASGVSAIVVLIVFVLLAVLFFAARDFFLRHAHTGAAIGFFAMVVLAIALNVWTSVAYRATYGAVLTATVLVGLSFGIARLVDNGFETFVFWLEAVGIAGFMAFWLVQTREMMGGVGRRDAGARSEPEPDDRAASMA